jgi:hypothetical protein
MKKKTTKTEENTLELPTTEEQPIKTYMGINKINGQWEFNFIRMKGKEIIEEENVDASLRSFAFEEFKTRAVQEFLKEV